MRNAIEEVIRRAVMKGGYHADLHFLQALPEYARCQLWLDPLFWQSLGKAQGWVDIHGNPLRMCRGCRRESVPNTVGSCNYCGENAYGNFPYMWQGYWHRFIDHLATGGDPETFFRDLLKSNETTV